MRIVIDARESGTSTGRYVDNLIDQLQVIDKENQYIIIYKQERMWRANFRNENFSAVSTKYKEFSFGEQLGFAWQLYTLRADLVHFAIVQHPLLYFGKHVTSMLDLTTLRFRNPSKNFLVFWIKQRVYWIVNFAATRTSRRIITISDFVKTDISKKFRVSKRKITTTYSAADKIQDAPEPINDVAGKQFIMYVGRPTPHKNLERLMDIMPALQETHPDLHLVLAGKKDELMQRHERRAEKRGIRNVLFTGFVSEGQLRWLYENTACYVFPSMSEGFGLPGLEAMKHGAPVASSNATSLPEIYGHAAKYFSPYSQIEMQEAILEVLGNKKLRAELIRRGKQQAAKFSWRKMAEQTLEIYTRAIKRG